MVMQAKSKFSFWRMILLLTAVCGLCAMAAVRPDIQPSVEGSKQPEQPEQLLLTPSANDEARDARVVMITIRPTGLDPKELALPVGRYLLVIANRSGLDQFAWRLERENGGTVHEVRPRRRSRDTKQLLQLTPGEYVLRELSHPDWTCRISVSAQ
jgi:hypothetical protein